MSATHTRPRPAAAIAVGWLAVAAVLSLAFVAPERASAKEWESVEQNVIVSIPEGPSPWEWLPFNSAWGKAGIVRGAKRELVKLKEGGKPATGQGGLMHLAVRDAPKDATVEALAENKDVRDFLLKRFKGSEGDVKVTPVTMLADGKDGHPAIVLNTSGKAFNLKGKEGPCTGILLATIARGKLIMMRLFAFPTEYDGEGVGDDIDYMEANSLSLITAKEKKGATDKGATPEKGEGDKKDGEGEAEDEGVERVIEFRAHKWRMTKHKKVKELEITDDEKLDFLVFKSADADRMGSYAFYIYAPPNSQIINGQQAPAPNLLKWIGPDWWNHFNNVHPKGELVTFKWPKKPFTTKQKTFITFADLDDEKAKKVVFKADKKRPVEASAKDMMKSFGFVEKVKNNKIGKGKASEAVRGCMSGKRGSGGFPGNETVFRWAFRNGANSYRIFVVFSGVAHRKWGPAIRETLESIEFGVKKFKD